MIKETTFRECDECTAKTGWALLCDDCIARRREFMETGEVRPPRECPKVVPQIEQPVQRLKPAQKWCAVVLVQGARGPISRSLYRSVPLSAETREKLLTDAVADVLRNLPPEDNDEDSGCVMIRFLKSG